MLRRMIAIVATLGLTLLIAAPALATVPLTNAVPISSDSPDDQGTAEECASLPDGVAPAGEGEALWHFVLNQYGSVDQTVTATFDIGGQQVTMTQSADWDNAGVLHFYFRTDAPATLISASASGDQGNLQLSHICNGGPGEEIPEAPASVLLLLLGGVVAAGFVAWQMRRSTAVA